MVKGVCTNCKKEKKMHFVKDGERLCNWCYRKLKWKPKLLVCKRCGRSLPMQAYGLCKGCYNSVFHIEKVRLHNSKKYHNISSELYQKLTKKCVICDFNKIIDLHHLDNNHNNNSEDNLIGLCPNHHKLVHHRAFRKEIFQILQGKGFKIPEIYKDDDFFKELKERKKSEDFTPHKEAKEHLGLS